MSRILCLALEGQLELSGAECIAASHWQEARQLLGKKSFDAVVCGLWCPAGQDQFQAIDAHQVLTYLRNQFLLPGYVVLSPVQAQFTRPLQALAEAVMVVGGWKGAWRAVHQRLRQDLALAEEAQPCNEILLVRDGQPHYQFQCLQADLRADLATFLDVKGQSLQKTLALGSRRACRLEGEELSCGVRFLGPTEVLWTAHHPIGAAYPELAQDSQQRALAELGVRL